MATIIWKNMLKSIEMKEQWKGDKINGCKARYHSLLANNENDIWSKFLHIASSYWGWLQSWKTNNSIEVDVRHANMHLV